MTLQTDNRGRLLTQYTKVYGANGYTGSVRESDMEHENLSDADSDSGYTELLRGSVPCPTCRGLGNVPKEQESQLIALIPLKDDRLKPRRTKLWVCLAVFMCVLIAGLVLFFMFPRSVNIESLKPYLEPHGPVYINVSEKLVTFTIVNSVNVSNENYFSLKVTSMKLSVLYDTQVIAESSNFTSLDVPMRSKESYFVGVNVSLDKHNQMGYMAQSCENPIRWAHEMVMMFDFTCNYEYLGHSEQTTLQTFQFVSCYSDVKPTTTAKPKPTTSHTTTPTITVTNDKF